MNAITFSDGGENSIVNLFYVIFYKNPRYTLALYELITREIR